MRRLAAAALALCVLLSGCGVSQVDITSQPSPSAYTSPSTEAQYTPSPSPSPNADDLVRAVDIIPNLYTDVRYAADNNFTGAAIYDSAEVYLRYATAEKLARVQERLNAQGHSLCIWDGWRSLPAQFALWRACPDPAYVSNPFSGLSGHCRGNTVDITLVTIDGEYVEMPTDFDNFTALADRDYSDVSPAAAGHALLLQEEMYAEGFIGYQAEWWHYSDSDSYEIKETLEEAPVVNITSETRVYDAPDAVASLLFTIPAGSPAAVLDDLGGWLLVRWEGAYGYIEAQ